ncbi:MAG: chemotaxis protein CheR, partial [Afipia sp.]
VFGRMQKINEPDGYLFLGAAETVIGLTDAYRACPDLRGVYAPNPGRMASPSLAPGIGMRSQKAFAAS